MKTLIKLAKELRKGLKGLKEFSKLDVTVGYVTGSKHLQEVKP